MTSITEMRLPKSQERKIAASPDRSTLRNERVSASKNMKSSSFISKKTLSQDVIIPFIHDRRGQSIKENTAPSLHNPRMSFVRDRRVPSSLAHRRSSFSKNVQEIFGDNPDRWELSQYRLRQ
jgi:hypothetical protein